MRPAHQGFTLVEVIVVIGILGVVAAVTVPTLRDVARADPLRDGAAAVTTILQRARMTARTNGHRVTVAIDPATRRYWIDRPALSGVFELHADVRIRSDRERPRAVFEPAGVAWADPLSVMFGGKGKPIVVDPLTGAIASDAR